MRDFEIFSIRLKELRKTLDLTQKQFAEKVGTTSVTVSAYENNAKKPSLDIVKNIAEKCNVSIDWLCGLSDKKSNNEEIKTYSDMIRILLKATTIENIDISLQYCTIGQDSEYKPSGKIVFNDDIMADFISEWKKIRELYNSQSVDFELYNLWIEKTIKKYNYSIGATKKDD